MIARGGYGEGDYGEVFGLARACEGVACPSPEEMRAKLNAIAKRAGVTDGAFPTAKELDQIWNEMRKEHKMQNPVDAP